jgi:hypothetical protein
MEETAVNAGDQSTTAMFAAAVHAAVTPAASVSAASVPAAIPANYLVGVQSSIVRTYNGSGSKAIGVTLIICALLDFTFNSVQIGVGETNQLLVNGTWIGHMSSGYWNGLSVNISEMFLIHVSTRLHGVFDRSWRSS